MNKIIAFVLLIVGIIGYIQLHDTDTIFRYVFLVILGLTGGYLFRNIKWKGDEEKKKRQIAGNSGEDLKLGK